MGRLRFQILSVESEAGFCFQLLAENGDILLASEDFTDRETCLAAIRVLLDALIDEDCYALRDTTEGQVVEVSGPDGRVLARGQASRLNSAEALRDSLVETASEQEEYEILLPPLEAARSTSSPAFRSAIQINLAERYDFDYLSTSGAAGFEPFQNPRDGLFYFHFNDAMGAALLYSRGFSAAAQRNRRLRLVAKSGVLQ